MFIFLTIVVLLCFALIGGCYCMDSTGGNNKEAGIAWFVVAYLCCFILYGDMASQTTSRLGNGIAKSSCGDAPLETAMIKTTEGDLIYCHPVGFKISCGMPVRIVKTTNPITGWIGYKCYEPETTNPQLGGAQN